MQVHVIDASSPSALQQRRTVLRVLAQLGMSEHFLRTRMVEVWNKADCLAAEVEQGSHAEGGGPSHLQTHLWRLVQNHLYHEYHQVRSTAPSYDEETIALRNQPPEEVDDLPHGKRGADENDNGHRNEPPEVQELDIESDTDSDHDGRDVSIAGRKQDHLQATTEGVHDECMAASAVVVSAKTGLGLTWLVEVITQKLQQRTESSKV